MVWLCFALFKAGCNSERICQNCVIKSATWRTDMQICSDCSIIFSL